MSLFRVVIASTISLAFLPLYYVSANEPAQSRIEFYDAFVAQEIARNPEIQNSDFDIESDPAFIKRLVEALYQYESDQTGPLESTGQLIEEGPCDPNDCGPLTYKGSSGNSEGHPRIKPPTSAKSGPNSQTLMLFWLPPRSAQGQSAQPPRISHYQVLVTSEARFWLYEVTGRQTFGRPARNRGRPLNEPFNGEPASNGSQRPPHSQQSHPRQHFRYVRGVEELNRVYVRPVYYKGNPYHSENSGKSNNEYQTGSSGTTEISYGAFSEPLEVSASTRGSGGENSIDTNLDKCINANLKSQGLSDSSELLALNCDDYGIISLEGLDELSNLQVLSLNQNPLSDITLISQLANLQSLSLAFTNITGLDSLQSLTALENLVISHNQIIDLAPLANLGNLESIHAQGNQIIEVPDLSGTSIRAL